MKTIGYAPPYVPPEWIAAHGLMPVRLQPDGPASKGPVPPTAGICPYMRALVNQFAGDTRFAGVVFTTVCDQMRRGGERLQMESVPAFCLNVPATWQTPTALGFYVSELERLSRFLVHRGGTRPNDGALAETMQRYEAQRQGFGQMPPPAASRIPILVTGGPRSRRDARLLELIEAEGGCVVLDATETGALSDPPAFQLDRCETAPLRVLADAYLRGMPGVSRRPNDWLFTWLALRVEQTGAAGVVVMRYLWCDLWHAEVARIRAKVSVPVLDVDLDGEDPVPRNRTRIQAFLEALR